MALLTQFLLRLAFGLSLAMATVSPRQVTGGYYRVHALVLLGLNALAAMLALSAPTRLSLAAPIAAGVLSYLCAVCWWYEKAGPGLLLLIGVALAALCGAWWSAAGPTLETLAPVDSPSRLILAALDPATSGLVLGSTMAAMLLGHWYLNAPGMQLAPLKRLIATIGVCLVLRAVCCGWALGCELQLADHVLYSRWPFLALRWLAGIAGTGTVAWMAWQTLKIPNTQSATGILYVGVITTFLGELAGQLLSATARFPL